MRANQLVPFVGLRPFESEDSIYYFGRDQQIRELLQCLHNTRFLAVVGSSGCGKSSLIRAGLIPHLEAGFLVQDRDLWHVARMKPGDSPIDNLAATLCQVFDADVQKCQGFAREIRDYGSQSLLNFIVPHLNSADSNLFILVDQFEELFRFGLYTDDPAKREDAAAFVALLLQLSAQTDYPVYICLTMRSDYIGDCDAFAGLPQAMNRSQYLVPRLTREQRREAIAGPVHTANAAIAPRLLDRLLNESGNDRDDLPVLQHVLMRTWFFWQQNSSDMLDIEHYEKAQTIYKALDQHAEEAYQELDGDERVLAKKMFQALTMVDPEKRRIRRPTHYKKLAAICNVEPAELLPIIKRFRDEQRNFLVLFPPNIDRDPIVDIAHESLIRNWDRLKNWVDEEAEAVKDYKDIVRRARRHSTRGGSLLSGSDLLYAIKWKNILASDKSWAAQYTDKESEAEENRIIVLEYLEKSRQKNDAENEEQLKKKRREERQRIYQLIAPVIAIILIFWIWSVTHQWLRANYNVAKSFEEKAGAFLEKDPQTGIPNPQKVWLYTLAALNQKVAGKDSLPISWGLLANPAFSQSTLVPLETDFIPDQNTLLSIGLSSDNIIAALSNIAGGDVKLWMPESNRERVILSNRENILCAAFSRDGRTFVAGTKDYKIKFWDTASGEVGKPLLRPNNHVLQIAVSNDKVIASLGGYGSKEITLWSGISGARLRSLPGHEDDILSFAFSADARRLASASKDNSLIFWDVPTGTKTDTWGGQTDDVMSLAFNSDDRLLAAGTRNGIINLWHISTEKLIYSWRAHSSEIVSLAFSDDGPVLVSGSSDKTIKRWDLGENSQWDHARDHTHAVTTIVFNPRNRHMMASGSTDERILLWDFESGHSRELGRHRSDVYHVTFSPDGKTLASSSKDAEILLWDVETGKKRVLQGNTSQALSVAFSPDGTHLAAGYIHGTIVLWDVSTQDQMTMREHTDHVNDIVYNQNGTLIASASSDNTIIIWEAKTGKVQRQLIGHKDKVLTLDFAADGRLASGAADGTIILWDVSDGTEWKTFPRHESEVVQVAFSPNGSMLVAVSGNIIRLWDVATGRERARWRDDVRQVNCVAFSPDGETLLSGSEDGAIRRWDLRLINRWEPGRPKVISRLFEASQYVLGYKLDELELVPTPRSDFKNKYPTLNQPRPEDMDPVEWLLWAVD
ncbi:hypothetical protein JW998_09585 [candidate division KSB1 bacterium]|nr:hypothetical protein [candidate division KSB1 bacterium]